VQSYYETYIGKPKQPHVHPIVKALTDEWKEVGRDKHPPTWDNISVSYIEQLCLEAWEEEPVWHPDLTAFDISLHMTGMSTKKM
jgi:hypothetical protein